ncbi:hypothetical protein LINPERHAP2_LOCUS27422 [Linum perenne]
MMHATSVIMSQPFSMKVFHNHRFTAITEIKNFLTTVCACVFGDILQPICKVSDADELRTGHLGQDGVDGFVPAGGLWAWEPTNNATDDEKTLFLTFLRGFPVTKDEVIELFTRKYGEGSVVGVMMHENLVYGEQQPLFAKIMLKSVTLVEEVLGGEKIAKFRTNGKHMWARKYERSEQTAMVPASSPQV